MITANRSETSYLEKVPDHAYCYRYIGLLFIELFPVSGYNKSYTSHTTWWEKFLGWIFVKSPRKDLEPFQFCSRLAHLMMARVTQRIFSILSSGSDCTSCATDVSLVMQNFGLLFMWLQFAISEKFEVKDYGSITNNWHILKNSHQSFFLFFLNFNYLQLLKEKYNSYIGIPSQWLCF